MNKTMRVVIGWTAFTVFAVFTHSIALLPYFIISASLFLLWFVVYMVVVLIRCLQRDRREKISAKANPVVSETSLANVNPYVKCALLRSVKLTDPDGTSVRVPRGAVVSCLSAALGDDEAMVSWARRSGPVLRGWVDVAALKLKKSS